MRFYGGELHEVRCRAVAGNASEIECLTRLSNGNDLILGKEDAPVFVSAGYRYAGVGDGEFGRVVVDSHTVAYIT